MVRLSFLLALVVGACTGCGASTATQDRQQDWPPDVVSRTESRAERHAATAVPENPSDRGIRRDLNLAISHDADLKDREISFIVANGDVSVSGTVRTEEERKRINNLAMNIGGVKSVANAVLIAE
jgi:osmotically-inducible protein OsmY